MIYDNFSQRFGKSFLCATFAKLNIGISLLVFILLFVAILIITPCKRESAMPYWIISEIALFMLNGVEYNIVKP